MADKVGSVHIIDITKSPSDNIVLAMEFVGHPPQQEWSVTQRKIVDSLTSTCHAQWSLIKSFPSIGEKVYCQYDGNWYEIIDRRFSEPMSGQRYCTLELIIQKR